MRIDILHRHSGKPIHHNKLGKAAIGITKAEALRFFYQDHVDYGSFMVVRTGEDGGMLGSNYMFFAHRFKTNKEIFAAWERTSCKNMPSLRRFI